MRRQKRTYRVPPSYVEEHLGAQLELFKQEDNCISMSDWLRRVFDEYTTMRIAKQKIGRRIGNQ